MRAIMVLCILCILANLTSFTLIESPETLHCDETLLPELASLSEPEGAPAPLPTHIWMWREGDVLHIDIEAAIDDRFAPGSPTAPDEITASDSQILRLRTLMDEPMLYTFYFCPHGNIYDGVMRQGYSVSTDWNSGYSYESVVEGDIWTISASIPLSSMRITGEPPYRWSMQVLRTITEHRPNQTFGWPLGEDDYGFETWLESLAPLKIDSKIEKPRNYHAQAYFNRSYDLVDETHTFDPDHVGLTLAYRPTQSTTIKATLNPDFSEVPPDDETDTSNAQYAEYLSENRFFFIEDLDAFGLDNNYLYTRAITQPQYAIKATGVTKHLVWAVLHALDKKIIVDEWLESDDDMYTVAGLRPQWGDFDIQFDIQNRRNENAGREAFTGYVSPHWAPGETHDLVGAVFFTDDITPGRDRRRGFYGKFSHSMDFGDWYCDYFVRTVSTDFAPAIASPGCDENNGFHGAGTYASWRHTYEDGHIRTLRSHIDLSAYDYYHDDSDPEFWTYASFAIDLPSTFSISVNGSKHRVKNDNTLHDEEGVGLGLGYSKYYWLYGNISVTHSNSIIYRLNETRGRTVVSCILSGVVAQRLNYMLFLTHYEWHDLPPGLSMDNSYDFANVDVSIALSRKLFVDLGLRAHNCEMSARDDHGALLYKLEAHLGGYASLNYIHNDMWSVYAGFNSVNEEWNDHWDVEAKTAWMKVKLSY